MSTYIIVGYSYIIYKRTDLMYNVFDNVEFFYFIGNPKYSPKVNFIFLFNGGRTLYFNIPVFMEAF